jgi:transposase-like protein
LNAITATTNGSIAEKEATGKCVRARRVITKPELKTMAECGVCGYESTERGVSIHMAKAHESDRDSPWQDKDNLQTEYVEKRRSASELSKEWGCHECTIFDWLERHGLERPDDRERPWRDKEKLEYLYNKCGKSQKQIANEWGVGKRTISKWMRKHQIDTRDREEAKRKRMRKKPASFYTDSNGYEVIRNQRRRGGKVDVCLHHRLLATLKYNIGELKGNHIHHENKITWDNRLENLELLSPRKHGEIHAHD